MKGWLLVLGVFAVCNEIQKKKEAQIYYVDNIVGGYNGITIPTVGIFIKNSERGNKMLLEHERIHWKQYQREGLVKFLANYTIEHFKKGYDHNDYEIEARLLSGEKPECLSNYTNCVKRGEALTVSNADFRNT